MSVNILVIGDRSVGKSSIIATLASGSFPPDSSLPQVLQQIQLINEFVEALEEEMNLVERIHLLEWQLY